ncbi:unnamed protein product [Owenia fusiformis]|nr:unnamed protein product [Owenia fusiformis]
MNGGQKPPVDTMSPEDWWNSGQEALTRALNLERNTNVAKNTILFIGDGMGPTTVTAGRIYKGQLAGNTGEEYVLSWETFPHMALSKTYATDRQGSDSAATATAYLCGHKTANGILGVNSNGRRSDCSTVPGNEVSSILNWAEAAGKSTGIVTTTRVTHASPSALYANIVSRSWEHDTSRMPAECDVLGVEDIALQLYNKGENISVVFGGGRQKFQGRGTEDVEIPGSFGQRNDERNLIQEWQDDMVDMGRSHAFVWNEDQFNNLDPANVDYVWGLFERSHMQYEYARELDLGGEPSIAEMTRKAIQILQKNANGYFLFVEGGRIDHAHHGGRANNAVNDTSALADAVQVAIDITSDSDTLIVVTADHSHTLALGGYPSRGNPIGGKVGSASDGLRYTSMTYGNGPGYREPRPDIEDVDTEDMSYQQQTAVPLGSETHGSEDVAIYARGPMAHLFHGVQEQHYIPHAMAYAACIGANTAHCNSTP